MGDERNLALDHSYHSGHGTGEGVHVYILDTGIRTTHSDFGGRAIPTLDMCGRGSCFTKRVCNPRDRSCAEDRHGHGTHCAGTVGGEIYGVAKKVTLHAAKVLSNDGFGSTSAITGAIDWVVRDGPKPAVISMSLGGPGRDQGYRSAIDSATRAGVTVVVASGNDNADACRFSPAFVPSAITVGATDSRDSRAGFSNYGTCVDIMAPGVRIKSAGRRDDFSSATMSGTSMACPHVAGVVALLTAEDRNKSPEEILNQMLAMASNDKLSGLRGEPNKLLFNGEGHSSPGEPNPTPSPSGIRVQSFNTEGGYDLLQVNGVDYSGTDGPVGVTPVGEVVWSSDYSVQQTGWRLCMASGSPQWRVIEGPCGVDSSGCALSPNYPNRYAVNQKCRLVVGNNAPQPTAAPTREPTPPPTRRGGCPWSQSSGHAHELVCGDSSRWNVLTEGWGCCLRKGMRKECPDSFPTMCNQQTCGGGDYCCSADQCASADGPRACAQTPLPTPSPTRDQCPWRGDSGEDNKLLCEDGDLCDVTALGWACCMHKGGRQKCPRNAPTMCSSATCGAGRREHCCAHEGTTCDGYGGDRTCPGGASATPAPTARPASCPWQHHSGEDDVLECSDGATCNARGDGWDCCASRQPRQERQRCPQNCPEMCNHRGCAGGGYCCSVVGGCEQLGHGLRPCA